MELGNVKGEKQYNNVCNMFIWCCTKKKHIWHHNTEVKEESLERSAVRLELRDTLQKLSKKLSLEKNVGFRSKLRQDSPKKVE